MIPQVYFPSAKVSSIVKRYEYYDMTANTIPMTFLVLPGFDQALFFYLPSKGRMKATSQVFNSVPFPLATVISSLYTTYTFHSNIWKGHGLRVVLKEGVLASLLGVPQRDLRNTVPDLTWFFEKNALFEVLEKMNRNESLLKIIPLIERLIMKKTRQVSDKKNWFFHLNNFFLQKGYSYKISDLAQHFGYSVRQFRRKINNQFGFAPSELLCVHRFNQALHFAQSKPDTSLTEVAYRHYYYDQAHFNREFRRFTGMAPREYLHHIDEGKLISITPPKEMHYGKVLNMNTSCQIRVRPE